jgi:hypothetical protein
VPEFIEPEVALVTAGVEYDVLGIGFHLIEEADRLAVPTSSRSSRTRPGRSEHEGRT